MHIRIRSREQKTSEVMHIRIRYTVINLMIKNAKLPPFICIILV